MTTKTKAEAVRPIDERPERSLRCIGLARARCWNGVLPATVMGGDLSPLVSLR